LITKDSSLASFIEAKLDTIYSTTKVVKRDL